MFLNILSRQKAVAFISTHARPLERARYAFHFTQGSAGAVLAALAEYQNADGGFGHGLEPDFRLPASSAICTSIALQVLRAVGAPGDSALVTGALRYLRATFDEARRAWPIIPANDNSAPHAPWWNYAHDIAQSWNNFQANPRAEIVGYLYAYTNQLPTSWLAALGDAVLTWLDGRETLEMHDLLCYMRLMEAEGLPEEMRRTLITRLRPCVEHAVTRDPAQWGGYCLQPLQVVTSPDSPFYAQFAGVVADNLDYLIARQTPDGYWPTTWAWDTFPDVWPLAEREWQGVLTLDALRTLQKFERLKG